MFSLYCLHPLDQVVDDVLVPLAIRQHEVADVVVFDQILVRLLNLGLDYTLGGPSHFIKLAEDCQQGHGHLDLRLVLQCVDVCE